MGVHRLMRNSPFDKRHRRQTSFCSVEAIPFENTSDSSQNDVQIDPKDYHYDIYCSSGPGGQGVNTTYSAVRLVYHPRNIVITVQNERSQIQNRKLAMDVLKAKLRAIEEQERKDKVKSLVGNVDVSFGSQIRTICHRALQAGEGP